MHTPFKQFTILTVIAQLPQLSLSTWTPGKAAQINFYIGGTCTAYSNEATSWWISSPLVGGSGAITGAECFLLGMHGDLMTGINTAMMWEESTASDTVEPDQANGWCMFWDGFDCTGNELSSVYVPAGAEGAPCEPARSKDGFLWKSGKCFIDATTMPAPPRTSALTSTPTTPPTLPSTTSLSTSIGHTSPTSSSSTSLSAPTSSHASTTITSSASPPGYSSSISASLESASTPPQSKTRTTKRRNSLSSATIAGVIAGAVSLVVVAILLAFCIWRRGRKKPEAILPYLLVSEQHGQEAQRGFPALSEKSKGSGVGTEPDLQPRSPTPGERRRHQSLVANELRALREEMERLNSAMTSGDGNDARIRALERELQSYADAERLDPSLPGYLY